MTISLSCLCLTHRSQIEGGSGGCHRHPPRSTTAVKERKELTCVYSSPPVYSFLEGEIGIQVE